MSSSFPELSIDGWRRTRDSIQSYAQVLGAIRAVMAPREKHWWHVGLRVSAAGLTTTLIPAADRVFECALSLIEHRLYLATNRGEREEISLQGQSVAVFREAVLSALGRMNIHPPIDRASFADGARGAYDKTAVGRFWQTLPLIDAVLKQLKSEHRGESGPVQLWPHHFDLALLLFTGRRVSGADPADEESADEQMTLGSSPAIRELRNRISTRQPTRPRRV